jgi:phosphoribosylamine--glycine ligase
MVDALGAAGVAAFGPTAAAARVESSKIFAKNRMRDFHIPTAAYGVFDEPAAALAALPAFLERGGGRCVVKADGLALGKGVSVCQNRAEAETAVRAALVERKFGKSGERIVIEEFLEGPEISVLALTDGKTLLPLPSAMDHKRAVDGDAGPNTGGMGAVSPNPFYTEEASRLCMDLIFMPTIDALSRTGSPFSGCLYFGLMLTSSGPKVIEYNCRFGDPETEAVLPLLQGDLFEMMRAASAGRLDTLSARFSPRAAACVVLASEGYPDAYQSGFEIRGIEAAVHAGAEVFCAAVARNASGRLVSSGGRVLGVTAEGETLAAAVEKAYAACGLISFSNMRFRRDIGARARAG